MIWQKHKSCTKKATTGTYEKSEFEDIESIVQGIVGQKRRIHISFGDVITDAPDTPDELAAIIDKQITENYHLFPSNYIAADIESDQITAKEQQLFAQKLAEQPQGVQDILRRMYALPAQKKQHLE